MPGSVLLIVVDSPAQRALFNRHFGPTPHHLVFAEDGEQGFDRFAEVKPDLVIAHIHAARLDGTILCQLIRQQPRGEQVPFVLASEEFTGDPAPHRERVRVVGADDVLPLPFDRGTLFQCLLPLLSFGRPQGPPPSPASDDEPHIPTPSNIPIVSALDDESSGDSDTLDVGAVPEIGWRAADALLDEPEAPPSTGRGDNDSQDTVVAFVNPAELGELKLPSLAEREHGDRPPVLKSAESPFVQDAETHIELLERSTEAPSKNRGRPLHESTAPLPRRDEAPLRGPATIEVPATRTQPDGFPARVDSRVIEERAQRIELKPPPGITALEEPERQELLDEPPIAGRESSSKVRLIQEPPRDLTPSAERAAGREASGPRRGLDESQLGKRLAKRVRAMHRLLDEVDYYQLLGVDPEVSQEGLRRAYFELSLEFHPDRFFLLRSGELKEKIYAIYRRITEAYSVLSDERRRAQYEEGRRLRREKRAAPEQRGEPRAAPPPPAGDLLVKSGTDAMRAGLEVPTKDSRARRFVDSARAAYAKGNLLDARLHLSFALAYEADNPILRAAIDKVAQLQRPR